MFISVIRCCVGFSGLGRQQLSLFPSRVGTVALGLLEQSPLPGESLYMPMDENPMHAGAQVADAGGCPPRNR